MSHTPATASLARPGPLGAVWPYVQIARIDHWFKNAFMLLGVLLAVFYRPELARWSSLWPFALAVAATCLVASSNYVLNEWLDGPTDRMHPEKRHRPVPSGKIKGAWAYAEWILLAIAGLALASRVNAWFALSALWLWVMGVLYNVPPVRTKEWPYVDVLSESINNPIRLLLGWFALIDSQVPPVSLMLAYWMVGAYFMGMKRFAEYRHIGDAATAGAYRKSFRYYTEDRLLISILFYACCCAFFAGIFIVRYHIELIFFVPFAAGLMAYYLKLGLKADSPTQHPERLYKERGFLAYLIVTVSVFVALMCTSIPTMYDWFNVPESRTEPLWRIGPPGNGPER
jgi:4-hydroxybenzoate polyprenyltransferase